MDWGLLTLILVGLVAGGLGKWIMPGDDPGGCLVTMLLGIAGAFLGGFVASALGISTGAISEFSLVNIAFAVAGSVLLLFIYRLVKGKK